MSDDPVVVSLCSNYTDNGMATGRVSAVEVEGIEVETGVFAEDEDSRVLPKCSVILGTSASVTIGHLRIPISAHQNWYGNWCWDAVTMTRQDARRLLAYLIRKRGWEITGAPAETDLLPDPATSEKINA